MDENHCMWSLLSLESLTILSLEQYLIIGKFSKIQYKICYIELNEGILFLLLC